MQSTLLIVVWDLDILGKSDCNNQAITSTIRSHNNFDINLLEKF
jgi:hypothetical protein